VGRAIRRGVLRGERRSGVSKPVLLCLMGAAGALRFGSGQGARGQVFPSYRFPESAAMALSLAVQYAAFRRQPPGRLPWYGDVDTAAARREVAAALARAASGDGGETIWLEGEAGRRILGCFGIPAASGADEGVAAASDSLSARLEVRSDPSFGPLLHLLPAGKPPLVRITPLTDRDIRELMAAAGLPADCGIEELLGRVSQLVEELPWLSRMAAEIRCARDAAGAWRLSLAPGARLGLAAPARG
jgi:acyl-CoA synthetase (NDP forming)